MRNQAEIIEQAMAAAASNQDTPIDGGFGYDFEEKPRRPKIEYAGSLTVGNTVDQVAAIADAAMAVARQGVEVQVNNLSASA